MGEAEHVYKATAVSVGLYVLYLLSFPGLQVSVLAIIKVRH